jgi:hypothetical protein
MGRKSRAIEDYFHRIETPMQAYILGLLAADGNVYVNKARAEYKISLKLHREDEVLVKRTRDELAPKVNPNYPKPHYIRFEVCSQRMVNDLARYGVVPRKTWDLPWPEALLPHAFTSFLYCIATSGEKAEALDRVLNASGLGLLRKHLPGVWNRYQARMDAEKQAGRTSE